MSVKETRRAVHNAEADMTPMLDIVFILLIFFIVTTSFIKEEGLLINRPDNNKSLNEAPPVMVFNINETGLIQFNGKMVDLERIPARIENFLATNESTTAVVIPNNDTKHADVVNVLDSIKAFKQITISIGK